MLRTQFFLLCLSFFAGGCTHLFYQPTKITYADPKDYGLQSEDYYFQGSDGVKLHGILLKPITLEEKKPQGPPLSTLVFFHGNAQNLSSHFLSLAWMTLHKHQVFIFDYRGYGRSEGSPSQKGLYKDALLALGEAWKIHQRDGSTHFITYGQSLGGAVLTRALVDFKHQKEIDLLVLDSTFFSYQEVAAEKIKDLGLLGLFSPLAYLIVSDEMAPGPVINQIQVKKTLVIHAKKDPVVPYGQGLKVMNSLPGHSQHWPLQGTGHGSVFFQEKQKYRKQFLTLLKGLP